MRTPSQPEARVYRINRDTSLGRTLHYDLFDDEISQLLVDFRGDSRLSFWTTPRVVAADPKAPRHDISWLRPARLTVMTPKVIYALEPFLSMCGELLRVERDDGTDLYALNVLSVVDALATDRSDSEPLVLRPSFIEHRLGEPTVFMVPQLIGTLLCVEWSHIEDSFKKRVELSELDGLAFEPVWSSSDGADDLNLIER
jgi:hypothetical protein